jgi:D-glycero-D-manno-heptose 1,7-bisphosphate phosphatase
VAPDSAEELARRRTHIVTAFLEKGIAGEGWINAGVYLAGRGALARLPEGPSSLERDLLPALAGDSLLLALRCRCFFRDIGAPDRLQPAQHEFRWIRARF